MKLSPRPARIARQRYPQLFGLRIQEMPHFIKFDRGDSSLGDRLWWVLGSYPFKQDWAVEGATPRRNAVHEMESPHMYKIAVLYLMPIG